MSTGFDPYYTWLGIQPKDQPPNHYRLLGIEAFEDNPEVIEHAADRQMAHLRNFQAGKHSALSQKLLNEVAAAKVCLLRPEKKTAYDAQLRELLNRESAGEDTSSQIQALRLLEQQIASEVTRPLSRRRPASNASPWLAVGIGGGVLLAGVLAWSLMGRGKTEVAEGGAKAENQTRAESGQPKAEEAPSVPAPSPSPQSPIPNPQSLPLPPAVPQKKADAKATPGAVAGSPSGVAPSTPQSLPPNPQPLVKTESGSSAQQRQPTAEEKNPPSVMPPLPAVELKKAESQPKPPETPPGATARSSSGAAGPQSPLPSRQSLSSAAFKRPLPSPADQEKARQLAQSIFRDDYEKAKKPAEQSELARSILKKGMATRDPPADCFALLCLARDVAISADDDKLAYEAIDEMAKSFDVDPLPLKADALERISRSTRANPATRRALCERALSLGQECLEQDSLDAAERMAKLAFNEASRFRDKDLLLRSRALAKDQQEAAKAYAAVEEAFQTVKAKPDDPTANLAIGQYLCFTKGDWSKGLPHLAKGDDAKLKSAAERDIRSRMPGSADEVRVDSDECLQLADDYWTLAQGATGRAKDNLLVRAGFWYAHVEGNQSAATNARIAKRLDEISRLARRQPGAATASSGSPMTNSLGMKFVLVPAGEFWMGASQEHIKWAVEYARTHYGGGGGGRGGISASIEREGPPRRVAIRVSFYIGVFEVTQAEFRQVMAAGSAPRAEREPSPGDSARLPVGNVSWQDAIDFCDRLSRLSPERAARREYRLPTEAEWECAYYAGSTVAAPCPPETSSVAFRSAWYASNSNKTAHEVGQKPANPWGICDMLGNVSEWCLNAYDVDYYAQFPTASRNRTAAPHAVRGGNYTDGTLSCRPTFRVGVAAGQRDRSIGFRVVCVAR